MNTITIKRRRKAGTVTIDGLTDGDLRLIAQFIERGALATYPGDTMPTGVCDAGLRLADALRVPIQFAAGIGDVTLVGNTPDTDRLYDEVENLAPMYGPRP